MSKSARSRARRWTAEQARVVLEQLDRSGLSVHRFAVKHRLGMERLYRWKRRLRRGGCSSATETPKFAELTIRPTGSGGTIEVDLGGVSLRIAGESRVDDTIAILSRVPAR